MRALYEALPAAGRREGTSAVQGTPGDGEQALTAEGYGATAEVDSMGGDRRAPPWPWQGIIVALVCEIVCGGQIYCRTVCGVNGTIIRQLESLTVWPGGWLCH